jgi:hypothetical protein
MLGLAACMPPAKEFATPDAGEPPADARTCFGTTILQLCLETPPDKALQLPWTDPTRPAQIDTDSACTAVSGGDYCVVAGTTIEVTAPVRVVGRRPLVLIASRSIKLFSSGSIDVGGHATASADAAGGAPDACNAGGPPGMGRNTDGGGAGGTFMTPGGHGGDGYTVLSGPAGGQGGSAANGPRLPLTTLRGGCAGQAGAGADASAGSLGGQGGRAVLLIAQEEIDLSEGSLCAGGAGGGGGKPINNNMASGGGGGGAGGMIGLDAPRITTGMSTMIHADGGGGGEGSSFGALGSAGSDAWCSSPAPGGGHNPSGGDGGAGSSQAGNATVGKTGMFGGANGDQGGGGGGGGGAGIIIVPPHVTLTGDVSPQPTVTAI